eukprot:TRINITY_DN22248_c0_g1_i2.p1 TRINITY_DN22248_c0_g1~~TRINITY_DN22248_c0_g1_i2.p1  ORF type:complete len:323 (+),score=-2.85 TRINITY_DN22248_c0_g1_i2:225-1193(+)
MHYKKQYYNELQIFTRLTFYTPAKYTYNICLQIINTLNRMYLQQRAKNRRNNQTQNKLIHYLHIPVPILNKHSTKTFPIVCKQAPVTMQSQANTAFNNNLYFYYGIQYIKFKNLNKTYFYQHTVTLYGTILIYMQSYSLLPPEEKKQHQVDTAVFPQNNMTGYQTSDLIFSQTREQSPMTVTSSSSNKHHFESSRLQANVLQWCRWQQTMQLRQQSDGCATPQKSLESWMEGWMALEHVDACIYICTYVNKIYCKKNNIAGHKILPTSLQGNNATFQYDKINEVIQKICGVLQPNNQLKCLQILDKMTWVKCLGTIISTTST